MNPDQPVRQRRLASFGLTAVIVCLGLVVSALAAWSLARRAQADAQADFSRRSEQITTEVVQRLSASVFGLRGARGAYAASEQVDRQEFKALVGSMDLQREFPGNRGFGWVDRVPRAQLEGYLERVRASDSPGLVPRQVGQQQGDVMYIVRFIEPEVLSPRSMGADMGSDPRPRAAIEHAIATGETTLSAAVPLERDGQTSPGFLMFVPVYQGGVLPATVPERQANLLGVLYAPLIARDVLAGVTGAAEDMVTFQLFAGQTEPRLEA